MSNDSYNVIPANGVTPEDTLLAWVDVETTGVRRYSKLLEIACLVTDGNLNLLDETGYHATIYYPEEKAGQLKADAPRHVRRMHTKTGLWGKLSNPSSKPLQTVDRELAAYLGQFRTGPKQRYNLAGNSVRLDLNMVETYLSKTYSSMFSHRFLDVSSIELMARLWHGKSTEKTVENAHTAMADIRASLRQLKTLREIMAP